MPNFSFISLLHRVITAKELYRNLIAKLLTDTVLIINIHYNFIMYLNIYRYPVQYLIIIIVKHKRAMQLIIFKSHLN